MDNHNIIEEKLRTERDFKSGANWFYWIAGLSLINSVIYLFGGDLNFIVGLGITQFVDGTATALNVETGKTFYTQIALGIDFIIAGIFILFGIFAGKKFKWAFIVGMALYALDGIIFLLVKDYLSIGFHVFGLFWIFKGYKAINKLDDINQMMLQKVESDGEPEETGEPEEPEEPKGE